ncbi:hypothetical protein GO001_33475 [Streptomyces sp. NRRL B-1677]|uniref:FAD/NAD(P)-binding protein n=1 Tax=Streptomyces sp. NRRL B-1677 TaxID=2682966 RepID=UPI001892B70C|nr:FAD/NAD(P)-binding protein [Streptomyces sp. NRRL B-1677]MBF6050033.1 hypothetical protein [Streptomyces sp. NRRL B-1677]
MSAARTPAVAVIGGGACGIMACMALVRQAGVTSRTRLDVHLIEKRDRLGDGVAYASPYDWHLLNMQAATMSIRPEDPGDFITWLRAGHVASVPGAGGTQGLERSYVPRHRFGAYLRDRFHDSVREAEHVGIRIEVHHAEVVDLRASGGCLVPECRRSVKLPPVDRVVLCPGDLPDPAYRELAGHPRYHPDPCRLDDAVPRNAAVGVLGTSLTAVDALAHLHATGHHGPVHCFSRARPFPTVQPPELTPYTLQHLTPERLRSLTTNGTPLSLAKVADLLLKELHDATDGALGPARIIQRAHSHDGFAAEIEEAQAHRTAWYEALDATSPLAPHVWRALRFQDKTDFLASHHGLWTTWRHPMPLPNACRLHHLQHTGQLHWHPGIRTVTADLHGGFDIHCHHRGRPTSWHVDHLINATGTGYHPWLTASPLLAALLDRQALTVHPHGGVNVDFQTLQTLAPNGKPNTHQYFLGPLTRGVHFYTNAVETNLTNATLMATHLIRTLSDTAPHPDPPSHK